MSAAHTRRAPAGASQKHSRSVGSARGEAPEPNGRTRRRSRRERSPHGAAQFYRMGRCASRIAQALRGDGPATTHDSCVCATVPSTRSPPFFSQLFAPAWPVHVAQTASNPTPRGSSHAQRCAGERVWISMAATPVILRANTSSASGPIRSPQAMRGDASDWSGAAKIPACQIWRHQTPRPHDRTKEPRARPITS